MDGAQDFWGLIEPERAVLPLPVRQVLLLSIHGWAVETNTPEFGLPALPDRRTWLPVFIRLLHRTDWQNELQRLALIGLGPASPDLSETIERACQSSGLHAGLVDGLAIFASK